MLAIYLVYVLFAYLGLGVVFACWFVVKGMHKLDRGTVNASWKFRMLLFPGAVLLWSVLGAKLIGGKRND